MKKLINPNLLADETGLKNSRNYYTCYVCGKKIHHNKIQNSEWYYKINGKEEDLIYPGKNKIGYLPVSKIIYVCSKHYKILPEDKATEFAEIGLPYFLSRIGQNGGIFSF